MNKYLFGIFTGIVGALVVKAAYAKGFNKGINECKDRLELAINIQEINKKKDGES